MNWSQSIRLVHRWVSLAFTVAVVITFVAMSQKSAPEWVSFLPLPFLALLVITGLSMFASPYVARWRGERRTG